jgi:anti-anti-sigma regulatory factor
VLGIVKADDEGDAPRISYAEGDTQTFVCLEGRVCWTHGQVILESASSVLESGRDLIIDIAGCTHMDSTVLGTLHELAERADESGATLTIQGASPPLHRSFEELSMAAVTRRLTAVPTAVPTQRTVLELPETDVRRQQFRLLKAHEVLAQLSAENRNEFDDVVRNIRSDIVGERE